jgi:hypothetical protein
LIGFFGFDFIRVILKIVGKGEEWERLNQKAFIRMNDLASLICEDLDQSQTASQCFLTASRHQPQWTIGRS